MYNLFGYFQVFQNFLDIFFLSIASEFITKNLIDHVKAKCYKYTGSL